MSSHLARHALVVLSLALTFPSLASAQESAAAEPRLGRSSTVLTPSLLYSYGGGTGAELGVGLRLRLDHYPTRYAVRFGGFVDAEVLTDGSVRMAGGLANAMWLFGCELGIAYRSDSGRYASSIGLHVGKSFVLGPITIGGRLTIPLHDFTSGQSEGPARLQGIEGSVVLTFGLPTTLDGPERRPFDCGGHRHR